MDLMDVLQNDTVQWLLVLIFTVSFPRAGGDMGAGVQNREVPEAQVWDWEAEQKAGEEEGGSRRVGQPRQEQEKKIGGCEYFDFGDYNAYVVHM